MSHAPIARLENPSAEQLRACIRDHRPVILTGLTTNLVVLGVRRPELDRYTGLDHTRLGGR